MNIKEKILSTVKLIVWPFLRDKFICASQEEVRELILYARNAERLADEYELNGHTYDRDEVPKFIIRCINEQEKQKS